MSTTLSPKRKAFVNECEWWIAHTANTHYGQLRPIPNEDIKAHRQPLTTDCSGMLTGIMFTIGAPDPNGRDYDGQGYTGTIMSGCEYVSLTSLEPGDLIVCAEGDNTVHVYGVMRVLPAGDYLLFSHGREEAPETITFSHAKQIRRGQTFHGRRNMLASTEKPVQPKSYRWVVVNGAGERIGRTMHPVVWATRHPKAFRKFGQVRFIRKEG